MSGKRNAQQQSRHLKLKYIDARLSMYRHLTSEQFSLDFKIGRTTATETVAIYRRLNSGVTCTRGKRIGFAYVVGDDFQPLYPDMDAALYLHSLEAVNTVEKEREGIDRTEYDAYSQRKREACYRARDKKALNSLRKEVENSKKQGLAGDS
jgi:hypothetical protein